MEPVTPDETLAPHGAGRRIFLAQIAVSGAVAAAPVQAQEAGAERAWTTLAKGQPGVAETLARYAVNLKYEDLTPEVVHTAKRIVLDTFGCALGGYRSGPAQIAVELAGEITTKKPATVLCSGIKTSADLATFANGVAIRYLDFNDGFISVGNGHPSDSIAALLPAAELGGRNGRDLILATVLAYEVFCKVNDVLDIRSIGLDSSMFAGLAACVGAGRLIGLTEQQMVTAIGIFIGGNTAINQGRVGTLSNWKSYGSAESCRKAMFAVRLAQSGMTGPGQVFEGRDGFFNVISRKPFTLPPLGAPYGIMHAFLKRFALGQFAQTVAQAALESRRFVKDVNEIAEINVRVSRAAIKVMADSPEKWRPQTHETADHSMPYSVGVALIYGRIDPDYYEDPYLHDARLLDLVSRVKCIPSAEADRVQQEYNLCDLELVFKSGQRKAVRVEYHRGHWKNPMTDAEMEEKFRLLARGQLTAQKTDALLRQLWALEDLPKVGALVEMTRV
jgi:2-methylcitrate dehydratase